MSDLEWEGDRWDREAAQRAARQKAELDAGTVGPALELANEFAEIRVRKVETRNGARLLVESPRSGQWVSLCPLELESLTWQSAEVFSAMIANPYGPLEVDAGE